MADDPTPAHDIDETEALARRFLAAQAAYAATRAREPAARPRRRNGAEAAGRGAPPGGCRRRQWHAPPDDDPRPPEAPNARPRHRRGSVSTLRARGWRGPSRPPAPAGPAKPDIRYRRRAMPIEPEPGDPALPPRAPKSPHESLHPAPEPEPVATEIAETEPGADGPNPSSPAVDRRTGSRTRDRRAVAPSPSLLPLEAWPRRPSRPNPRPEPRAAGRDGPEPERIAAALRHPVVAPSCLPPPAAAATPRRRRRAPPPVAPRPVALPSRAFGAAACRSAGAETPPALYPRRHRADRPHGLIGRPRSRGPQPLSLSTTPCTRRGDPRPGAASRPPPAPARASPAARHACPPRRRPPPWPPAATRPAFMRRRRPADPPMPAASAAYERQDYAAAFAAWSEAAAGNSEAQFRLGQLYARGQGVVPNIADALAWYRRAADRGHAPAQYQLSLLYQYGREDRYVFGTGEWYRAASAAGQGRRRPQPGAALSQRPRRRRGRRGGTALGARRRPARPARGAGGGRVVLLPRHRLRDRLPGGSPLVRAGGAAGQRRSRIRPRRAFRQRLRRRTRSRRRGALPGRRRRRI